MTMSLLSLPVEILHAVLFFADWDDILSFISTTKFITDSVLAKSDIARLRRNCRARLLDWETERRLEQGRPLEPNPSKGARFEVVLRMYFEGPDCIPCYTCLRFRKQHMFSTGMHCGGRMLGQQFAGSRICIPCGVKTGFYCPGARAGAESSVCEKCAHLTSCSDGARQDMETLEDVHNSAPAQIGIVTGDGRDARICVGGFWWWAHSQMCAICVREAGYTVEQLLRGEPRKDSKVSRMKRRYKQSMFNSFEKRRERGKKIRDALGIAETDYDELLDVEALRLEKDPFPNFHIPYKYRVEKFD